MSGIEPSRTYFKACLFILALAFTLGASAQSGKPDKNQLQREKQKSLTRIQETEKILKETARKKKNSIGELTALQQRIRDQEGLIGTIRGEVGVLDQDLVENHGILAILTEDLEQMRQEYVRMVFATQRASQSVNKLTFLFSSASFDQFLMRLRYMEQYGRFRQEQARAIARVQNQLQQQVRAIDSIRSVKSRLLKDEVRESEQLSTLRQQQRDMIRSLEKEEKKLRKDLEETKKAIARLERLIAEIVKEEMARAARESRTAEGESRTAPNVSTSSFESNRKKFGWPVNGFISQRFGRQRHPVLPRVETYNDGINIQTREGEKVRSIFLGEVRRVALIPGIGPSVIINHGEYYTVYAGLKDVAVKPGQKVETGQEIGEVIVNSEGKSELRFQIRKNIVALNPEDWLRN